MDRMPHGLNIQGYTAIMGCHKRTPKSVFNEENVINFAVKKLIYLITVKKKLDFKCQELFWI